jgi:Pyruvate/2-oxoacid:ferredoxin oxidoreductase gamma subunit
VAYFALAQWFQPGLTVHVRAAGDPRTLIEPVRRELRRVNVDLPAVQPRTLSEHIAASTFVQRTGAALLGAFAAATGLVELAALVRAIDRRFAGELGRANADAARDGYDRAQEQLREHADA